VPLPIPATARSQPRAMPALPPAPEPDWLETLGAGFRTTKDDIAFVQRERLDDAYRPIVEVLRQRGDGGAWWFTNPVAAILPFQDKLDFDRIWQAVDAARAADPKAFADLPATREDFESAVATRHGARARDQRIVAAGSGVAGFIGSVGAMPFDPVNAATGILSGGTATLWQTVLREAVLNAGIEAVQQVPLAQSRARMGEELTGEEAALNVVTAGVFGGLLGGGAKFGADNWDAIKAAPKVAQERAWGALLERVPWLRERVGSEVAWDALDDHLPDMAESLIGRGNMSEAEQGAADLLRRGAQVEAASPFVANGAAAELHPRLLGEAMRRVLDDVPASRPLSQPAAGWTAPGSPSPVRGTGRPATPPRGRGLEGSTAISSRTVSEGGGAEQAFMQRVARHESGGSDSARNPRSSATGRYQFTDGTWLAYFKRRFGSGGLSDAQILRRRGEGELQDVLMRDLTADNAAFLRNRGEAVSEGNLYLVHFAGQGGARRLFEADPGAPVADVLGAGVVAANPHLQGMSAGDVIAWAHRAMGAAPSRRAGARAVLRDAPEGAPQDERGLRAALQQEIDGITAQLDALATDRQAQGDRPFETAAGRAPQGERGLDELPAPIDTPDLRARDAELADESPLLPDRRRLIDDKGRSLNAIDDLAAELGASASEVRRGLDQLVGQGRIVRRRDTGAYMRKPPAPARDRSLLEWIMDEGGVEDRGGDLRAMGADGWWQRAPFRKKTGFLRPHDPDQAGMFGPGNAAGHGPDTVFARAITAGYFPELAGRTDQAGGADLAAEKPDLAVFFAAIDAELRGTPRHAVDARKGEFAAERTDADTGEREEMVQRFLDAVEAHGEARGFLDDDPALLTAAALRWHESGIDPLWATELATAEHYSATARKLVEETGDDDYIPGFDAELDAALPFRPWDDGGADGARGGGPAGEPGDARGGGAGGEPAAAARAEGAYDEGRRLADLAPDQRAPFLDPESDVAKAQADSLLHDAKFAVRPEPSVLEAEPGVDPNIAARQAQAAQLGAAAPLRATADQESTLGLGLFGAADGVRLDAEGEARPLKDLLDELDAEAAEIKSIRDCL
jgi:hypothetical protein